MDIIKAMHDPELFGGAFGDPATWRSWVVVLKSIFGLDLDPDELATFQKHTGREAPIPEGFREAWLTCGRRAGKSRIMALAAVYLACFRDYTAHLAAGETGTVMLVAQDRASARVLIGYIRAFLLGNDLLARMVVADNQESISLRDNITIEVHSASFRTVRGRTLVAAVLDECAFWRGENSANPDSEILAAIRPGLATIPGSVLIAASSPHARSGELWNHYEQYYGRDGADVLVWQAATRDMNATVPQSVIDRAMAKDEPKALAEYGAQFRSDIEQFVRLETVQGCLGPYAQRPFDSQFQYRAFVDPSGGSSDSFSMAISHRERDQVFIDLVLEKKPPFSPDRVVSEFADLLRTYRVSYVTGDRYGGELNKELFNRHDIGYRVADKSASELYVELLPLLNAGRVTFPRNDTLVNQLVGLSRRVTAAGRELISHGSRKTDHDDLANAAAGSAWLQSDRHRTPMPVFGRYGTPDTPPRRPSKYDGVVTEGPLAGGFASTTMTLPSLFKSDQ